MGEKMINTEWSRLSSLHLGQFGEYYSKMLFASYGWYVYSPDIDDHGIDFIVESPTDSVVYFVQVKSVTVGKDTLNIEKGKLKIDNDHLICYLRFKDGDLPAAYIWKTNEWLVADNKEILGSNDYQNKSSAPEWNVKYSKKNAKMFERFCASIFFRD